jgi:cardiolipin synthase
MSEPVLTIANQLTILRMALAPVLVVLLHYRVHTGALIVFVVAGLTDLLDGLIARLGHQRTTLGATLDPVADKILLGSAYVALTWSSGLHCAIPVWLTVTLLSRDAIIVVSVAVINLTLGRRVFYPSLLGKFVTGSQLLTAGVVLLMNAAGECHPLVEHLFRLTGLLTVGSALHYVYRASIRRVPGPPGG